MLDEKREVNVKLNFLKGFACIGVVFIHIPFPGMFGEIILHVSAYALFFLYSLAFAR